MYWKQMRPFVIELAGFLMILGFLSVYFIGTKSIVFNWSGPLILLLIYTVLWFLKYLFSFVPFALLVLMDAILNDYDEIRGGFVEQFPYKSSSFLDKNGKPGEGRVETLFYKVVVNTEDGVRVLTASEYFPMKKNKVYRFVIANKSKVLVDVKDINDV